MSQETPQKIKLTLKNTPPLPPSSPALPVPPAAAPVSGVAVQAPAGVKDPLSLRDTNTSRLKRIKMDNSGQVVAAVVTPSVAGGRDKRDSTETVRLKIIREKRQGAAPAVAANQTIRLRPPAEVGGVPLSPAVPAAESAASPAAETVRVDVAAATVTMPTAAPANPVNKVSTATIKLRPGALPPPAAGQAIPAEPASASGSARHTIKIKMPAPVAGAGATAPAVPPDSGATIKLPSPGENAGATMKLPESPAGTGKRPLKFKVPGKPGESPAVATANAAAVAATAPAAAGASRPDVLVLAASVVTVLALGAMLGLLVVQGLRYGL